LLVIMKDGKIFENADAALIVPGLAQLRELVHFTHVTSTGLPPASDRSQAIVAGRAQITVLH